VWKRSPLVTPVYIIAKPYKKIIVQKLGIGHDGEMLVNILQCDINGNGNENISNAPPTVDRRRIT